MSTELILDFDKIRELDEPLPDIGVADFIPLRQGVKDRRSSAQSVMGVVLELNKPQRLRTGFDVPAGPGILYVHLPTGETLAEPIDVAAYKGKTTGRLTLKLARPQKVFEFSPHSDVAYSAPRRTVVTESLRAPSQPSDRSRWSIVKFDDFERPERTPLRLSSFLESFASRVVTERQGNRGIARIESAVGTFTPAISERFNDGNFDSLLVGQVQAVKPTKLYGARNDLHTQWKAPMSKVVRRSEEKLTGRFFALSFEAADKPMPLQVACVPGRWRTQADESAPLTVQYVSNHLNLGQQKVRVVVSIDDPTFKALLQFMQTGDLASSVSLLVQAEYALDNKFRNPYAAAAGAYVLTYAGYDRWNRNWGRWLHNLATHFPDLPDGHVLLANLILQGPSVVKEDIPGYSHDNSWELALRSVLESVKRGPPMYRFGLRMLSSSIAILNHLVTDGHADREQLNAVADYVRNLNMRVDRHQPFCVFDVGGTAQ